MFSKPKAVQIKLTKHQKNDKNFILPVRCIFCASTNIAYVMVLYNQHKTSILRIVEMIFGIFYVLFAFLNQEHRESCEAYACQHCQSFVKQRRKARKWLSVKWILMSIIAVFIWLLVMVFSYENMYFSGNSVLIVSIVYAISWLISSYLWIKQFEINIRQQYQLAKMSFRSARYFVSGNKRIESCLPKT